MNQKLTFDNPLLILESLWTNSIGFLSERKNKYIHLIIYVKNSIYIITRKGKLNHKYKTLSLDHAFLTLYIYELICILTNFSYTLVLI